MFSTRMDLTGYRRGPKITSEGNMTRKQQVDYESLANELVVDADLKTRIELARLKLTAFLSPEQKRLFNQLDDLYCAEQACLLTNLYSRIVATAMG